jgi:hypothetical protein
VTPLPDVTGLDWSKIRALARDVAAAAPTEPLVEAETATWDLEDARESFTYRRVLAAR